MNIQPFINQIKKSFPNFKYTSAKILKSGFDHDVLLMDKKIIFRFPKSKEYQKLLAYEIPLLNYLSKKLSVEIPHYSYVATDYHFAGYKILPGKTLNNKLLKTLKKSEKTLLIKKLADFLSNLHQIPVKNFLKYDLKPEKPNIQQNQFFTAIKKQVFPRLKEKEQIMIENFILEWKNQASAVKNTLTHNDLSGDNIFWDNKKLNLGIIDFSDRKITDPAHDFAPFFEFGEDLVKSIYQKYQGHKDAQFLQRAQRYYKKIALDLLLLNSKKSAAEWLNAYKLFKKRFHR